MTCAACRCAGRRAIQTRRPGGSPPSSGARQYRLRSELEHRVDHAPIDEPVVPRVVGMRRREMAPITR